MIADKWSYNPRAAGLRLRGLVIAALIGIALAAPRADAQGPNEAEIKRHFEGKRVTLRINMPGAADGVDIRVDRPFDAQQYGERLRRFGTSIRSGETATITTIKVKKDLVEFQLDGGGYGTFGDDTSLSVNMPDVQKSNREKDLEAATKRETDAKRKRELQRELDDVRNARERENRRIAIDRRSGNSWIFRRLTKREEATACRARACCASTPNDSSVGRCQCQSGAKARCASSLLSSPVAIHALPRTSLRTS